MDRMRRSRSWSDESTRENLAGVRIALAPLHVEEVTMN
jgi:hypothetical protein